jgi:hypothetical protein
MQTELSGFGHHVCPASTLDSSKFFPDLSGNLPGHVRSLSKKSQVESKSSFLVSLLPILIYVIM